MTTQADAHPKLRSMIESASQFVENVFAQDGAIASIWHYVRGDGQEVVMAAPPTEDKDEAVMLMRSVFQLENAVRCLFICEAWTVEVGGEAEVKAMQAWIARGGSAVDHPQRCEVILFAAEDDTGQLTAQRKIVRTGDKPQLGELRIDEFALSEGRYIGMLPQPRSRVH